MMFKMILSVLVLGCFVGILIGENIQLEIYKVDKMNKQLHKYPLAEYLNNSNLDSEHSTLLSRASRDTTGCTASPHFTYSDMFCRGLTDSFTCNQTCLWGHKFKNGKTSRNVTCKHVNGPWTRKGKKIPQKDMDCIPHVNCIPQLKGKGKIKCGVSFDKPTFCMISCGGKEKKYTCNLKGKWKPKLPSCAKPGKPIEPHDKSSEKDKHGKQFESTDDKDSDESSTEDEHEGKSNKFGESYENDEPPGDTDVHVTSASIVIKVKNNWKPNELCNIVVFKGRKSCIQFGKRQVSCQIFCGKPTKGKKPKSYHCNRQGEWTPELPSCATQKSHLSGKMQGYYYRGSHKHEKQSRQFWKPHGKIPPRFLFGARVTSASFGVRDSGKPNELCNIAVTNGKKSCIILGKQQVSCQISCGNGKKLKSYRCNVKGEWTPKLPSCAKRA